MLDKIESVHIFHAFVVGLLAGVVIVILDNYVVQPLETKVGVTPMAA